MSNILIDLTGQIFGYVMVTGRAESVGKPQWNYICKCGTTGVSRGTTLKRQANYSCGCATRTKAPIDEVFGALTVLKELDSTKKSTGGFKRWILCRCECGVEKRMALNNVLYGISKTCGGHVSEQVIKRNTTHNSSKSKEFSIWCAMRKRCRCNPRYSNVTVCERWDTFANFISDMGVCPSETHSIDRIDNLGNYEPSNCRWATPKEQSVNRRHVKLIKIGDIELTLGDWCKRLNIKYSTAYKRINKSGIPPIEALNMA